MKVTFIKATGINGDLLIDESSNSRKQMFLNIGLFKITVKIVCTDFICIRTVYKKHVKGIYYTLDKK